MPSYSYICSSCDSKFDEYHGISTHETFLKSPCPNCKQPTIKTNWEEYAGYAGSAALDPVRMGRVKPPAGFRELINHMNKSNRGKMKGF